MNPYYIFVRVKKALKSRLFTLEHAWPPLFLGYVDAATNIARAGGGGGGNTSGWGRDKDEDDEAYRRRCCIMGRMMMKPAGRKYQMKRS